MPKKKRSSSALSFIAQAWDFLRKQRALIAIAVWLFIVPIVVSNAIDALLPIQDDSLRLASSISLSILVLFITAWGTAAVLLVGRRMIQSKAGRARTSLHAVLKEATPWVLPFLFTSILQACFAFYRGLLFLLPAAAVLAVPAFCDHTHSACTISWPILLVLSPLLLPALYYLIRSSLFSVALFTENVRYRAALQRSWHVTKGKFRYLFSTLIVLSLLLVVLPSLAGMAIEVWLQNDRTSISLLGMAIGTVITQCGLVLFTLTLIPLYGELRKTVGKEIVAPEIEPG